VHVAPTLPEVLAQLPRYEPVKPNPADA
jgi:hypothetical protein